MATGFAGRRRQPRRRAVPELMLTAVSGCAAVVGSSRLGNAARSTALPSPSAEQILDGLGFLIKRIVPDLQPELFLLSRLRLYDWLLLYGQTLR